MNTGIVNMASNAVSDEGIILNNSTRNATTFLVNSVITTRTEDRVLWSSDEAP